MKKPNAEEPVQPELPYEVREAQRALADAEANLEKSIQSAVDYLTTEEPDYKLVARELKSASAKLDAAAAKYEVVSKKYTEVTS